MMITLLGSLLGLLGAAVPKFLEIWQQKVDQKHELQLMDKQIQWAREKASVELESLRTEGEYNYLLEEVRSLKDRGETHTGIRWVDALNASVRPIISYSFFLLYALIKLLQYAAIPDGAPLIAVIDLIWTEEDMGIFSAVIAYYFGSRAMFKHQGK